MMDLCDRQIAGGFRHGAAVRRGQEEEVARLVDQGIDPSTVASTFTANLMRSIIRRRIEEGRSMDPVEQAKTTIRQGSWRCFDAEVDGGPEGQFYIGNRIVGEAELLAFTELLRTDRRRRA